MNWGVPNNEYQPIIAPSDDPKDRKSRGIPIPARPDWLCISAPEYATGSTLTGRCTIELTLEQMEEIESAKDRKKAEREARQIAKSLEHQQVINARYDARVAEKEAISRQRQSDRMVAQFTFAEAIRELRTRLSMTSGQLGEIIGCDPSTVMNWENSKSIPRGKYIGKVMSLLREHRIKGG